mmetsp:Transcript_98932/g.236052  ORF Transcript_98932/g.236052 Transcript_98932/m.236052 type:complete len:221 (-) Transcript_98932:2898-3560(-)
MLTWAVPCSGLGCCGAHVRAAPLAKAGLASAVGTFEMSAGLHHALQLQLRREDLSLAVLQQLAPRPEPHALRQAGEPRLPRRAFHGRGPVPPQQQGGGHHRDRGEGHGAARDEGRQGLTRQQEEEPRGQGNAEAVVAQGEQEVQLDPPEDGGGEVQRSDHVGEFGAHQHHVRCLHGDLRPRADGDAQVRLRERRGIVHSVPHHRYAPGLRRHLPCVRARS